MRIVKLANESSFTCKICKCEFLYEPNDLRKSKFEDFLTCPNCNNENIIKHLDMDSGEVWTYIVERVHRDKGAAFDNYTYIFARNIARVEDEPSVMKKCTYSNTYSYSLYHKTVYLNDKGVRCLANGLHADKGLRTKMYSFNPSRF